MSDDKRDTPYRDARDPKRAAERDFEEVDRGSRNAPSDIEQAADPEPLDPETDMAYTHDDSDRERDGVHGPPLSEEYERVARRSDLTRSVEDVVAEARDWALETEDDDAQEILQMLVEVADRLGETIEDTDEETFMDNQGKRPR